MVFPGRESERMKQALFAIVFVLSFPVQADEGHWNELYNFHTTMAAQGSVEAEYKLGEMNEEGQGTEKDLKAAHEWYLKAAKHGHVGAEYKLGTFYEYGIGVDSDRAEAKRWYEKAAAHGKFVAQRKLKNWDKGTDKPKKAPVAQTPVTDKAEMDIKVRQAEKAKAAAAMRLKQQEAEKAKARQQEIARKRAEEQRARQAAQVPERTTPQPTITEQKKSVEVVQPKATPTQAVAADGSETDSFETDPCKTPAARFMSTCKNK